MGPNTCQLHHSQILAYDKITLKTNGFSAQVVAFIYMDIPNKTYIP